MPRIPLCPECDEPVIVEDQEYVDRTDNHEEILYHLTCYQRAKAQQAAS